MISGLIAASAMLLQQQSIYQRVIPSPDSRNGYDDYVRACDMIVDPVVDGLLAWYRPLPEWVQGKPEKAIEPGMTPAQVAQIQAENATRNWSYLQVQRELAKRAEKALAVVRVGNAKTVYDPRESVDANTTYPELAGFKNLAKLFVADAYVKFADGTSASGTTSLLDCLIFSQKTSGSNLLSSLVGSAMTSIALAGFESHLPQMSVGDCKRTEQVAEAMLAEPNHMVKALQSESKMSGIFFDEAIANPREMLGDTTERADEAARLLGSLSGADRAALRTRFINAAASLEARIERRLAKPEQEWEGSADDVQAVLADMSDPALKVLLAVATPRFPQVVNVSAKQRAQLRLLDLHARIREYRWNNARLPATLVEAVGEKLAQDPLTGEPFQYAVLAPDYYRLFSKGNKAIGQIELKMKFSSAGAGSTRGPNDPPSPRGS